MLNRLFLPSVVIVFALVIGVAPSGATPILVNGDFETGGGSLTGWTVVNEASGFLGNWFVQSGVLSFPSGLAVPAPPGPTHAAMTDQDGPGSHVLYQDFLVPLSLSSATLRFDYFIGNRAEAFATPASLSYNTPNLTPNQQARVDIITTTGNPFSVAAGDVLLNLYQTHVGDPLVSGYSALTFDLTSFLSARGGQTLRLRFAEVDNQDFFQNGVDRVNLDVAAVPEPTSLLLLGTGLVGIGVRRWRGRRRATL